LRFVGFALLLLVFYLFVVVVVVVCCCCYLLLLLLFVVVVVMFSIFSELLNYLPSSYQWYHLKLVLASNKAAEWLGLENSWGMWAWKVVAFY
jgi:hypothetical protein